MSEAKITIGLAKAAGCDSSKTGLVIKIGPFPVGYFFKHSDGKSDRILFSPGKLDLAYEHIMDLILPLLVESRFDEEMERLSHAATLN